MPGRRPWSGYWAKSWLLLLLAAAAPPPGAVACSGCHGAEMPLAGRDAAALTETLTAYRAGTREATVMTRIARGFSDAELGLIASWWAARR